MIHEIGTHVLRKFTFRYNNKLCRYQINFTGFNPNLKKTVSKQIWFKPTLSNFSVLFYKGKKEKSFKIILYSVNGFLIFKKIYIPMVVETFFDRSNSDRTCSEQLQNVWSKKKEGLAYRIKKKKTATLETNIEKEAEVS